MIGQIVSHYRIVRKLGAGGMGEVYEAEDLKLGRHVAVKFLPEALSSDRSALDRRFRLVAHVQHDEHRLAALRILSQI